MENTILKQQEACNGLFLARAFPTVKDTLFVSEQQTAQRLFVTTVQGKKAFNFGNEYSKTGKFSLPPPPNFKVVVEAEAAGQVGLVGTATRKATGTGSVGTGQKARQVVAQARHSRAPLVAL